MRVRDLQFVRHFLLQEIELPTALTNSMLEREVSVQNFGEQNDTSCEGDKIIVHNPSSITMFLFRVLQRLLIEQISDLPQKDKTDIALLYMCRDYVLKDGSQKFDSPPILVDIDKLIIPSTIIRDIVEPLVGFIDVRHALFAPCLFTDTARIVSSSQQLQNDYQTEHLSIGHEFPVVLVNRDIYNKAAQYVHLISKLLEASVGVEKSKKIVRNILLNDGDNILSLLLTVLKLGNGDPQFVLDFMMLLENQTSLTTEEREFTIQQQADVITSDAYLSQYIKTAQQQSQVSKQWSQWSVLMGLIEKQLEPVRGSMWPASENIKPHEDKLRLIIKERTNERGKPQANFEEMLEAARDLYQHNAVEPGQLIETMLKENRVWKI